MQQRSSESFPSRTLADNDDCRVKAIVPESSSQSHQIERDAVLQRLWDEFHRLNSIYFNGTLTLREIRLSTRKQYGGYYRRTESLIVLSWPAYCAFGWEETLNTFRHEVAHIVHWNHTRAFWELAERLGSTRKYARIPENRPHAYSRYVYECPACKARVFRRRRLIRSSCARCDRQFNSAYLLRLVSSPAMRQSGKH